MRPRSIAALAAIGAATLVLLPMQMAALRFLPGLAARIPRLWHRIALAALGIRVTVRGAPSANQPLFLVSNHISWTDIPVLGSLLPLSFIAKSEVSGWPGVGHLARMQRTVFVEREARSRTGRQAGEIAARLVEGDTMVLFAEGTTSDGNYIYPFRTALFGAAQQALRDSDAESVAIQPVAIAYVGLQGMPMGRYHRSLIAWPGDVALGPHLKGVLDEAAIDVIVSFGEAIVFDASTVRKSAARDAEASVRALFENALRTSSPVWRR
ncbi:MAG TPA: lysophospholipid acyltransferase family protein [Rhizobiaceae bacterium]|nr:lysophospholipid acyltransferase family protein [Rhizobiaceae bacterium]